MIYKISFKLCHLISLFLKHKKTQVPTSFHSNQVHNMFAIMLDLQFKSLQMLENLVGPRDAIRLVF
jgi:hypothetical protein